MMSAPIHSLRQVPVTSEARGRFVSISGLNYPGPYFIPCPSLVPSTQTPPGRPAQIEALYALVAKAVRWSAGRKPPVTILSIERNGGIVYAGRSTGIGIAYETSVPSFRGKLRFALRNRWGETASIRTVNFSTNRRKGIFEFRTPAIPAGEHFLDFWITQDNKVIDWSTAFLSAESRTRVEEIRLSEPYYEPGELVEAEITIGSPPRGSALLLASIRDSDFRIIELKKLSFEKVTNPVKVSLNLRRQNKIVYGLEVEVFSGSRSLAYGLQNSVSLSASAMNTMLAPMTHALCAT